MSRYLRAERQLEVPEAKNGEKALRFSKEKPVGKGSKDDKGCSILCFIDILFIFSSCFANGFLGGCEAFRSSLSCFRGFYQLLWGCIGGGGP